MVSEPARRAAPHPHGERNARIKTLGDQTINPANGETLQSFPDITDAALEAVLANAAQAYEAWRHKSYAARADVIGKAAALLHAQAESFAQTMTLEKGQRISEARGAVEFSARILTYYARNAERFLAPVTLHPMHGQALMASSPIGVIFTRDFCSGFLLWSPGTFRIISWRAWPGRSRCGGTRIYSFRTGRPAG